MNAFCSIMTRVRLKRHGQAIARTCSRSSDHARTNRRNKSAKSQCASASLNSGKGSKTESNPSGFELLSERKLFSRYQTVYARDIRYPNGQTVSFDVLGNAKADFKSVFVFPYDTATRNVTLIREYAPGHNAETLGVVAGMFDPEKHRDLEAAARAELSEEALLRDGNLVSLSHRIHADKYSKNEFFYYLALDCVADRNPGRRDDEEWISVEREWNISNLLQAVQEGKVNVPHSLCIMLAVQQLQKMGLHDDRDIS